MLQVGLTAFLLVRWESPDASNVEYLEDPQDVEMMLASRVLSQQPCIVHFFGQDCPGCKAMHPKVHQIMTNSADVHFIKVRLARVCASRSSVLKAILVHPLMANISVKPP